MVLAVRISDPFISNVLRLPSNPADMVSRALSLENNPVDRTEKAKTEETTTKAINTMAVSNPVIPRWSGHNPRRSREVLATGPLQGGGQ